MMTPTYLPLAPSYNGKHETFRLLIAPYAGDEPPTALQGDAEAFAYPYAVVSDSPKIAVPNHRRWSAEAKTRAHTT
jgi:hypothetical protein